MKNKATIFITILACLPVWTTLLFPAAGSCQDRIRTTQPRVMIDPGHGGRDSGLLLPSGLSEKTVTLTLSRLVAEQINKQYKVLLTRQDDRFLDTIARTEAANTQQADLFVSIHLKATTSNQATVFHYKPCDNRPIPAVGKDLAWHWQHLPHEDKSRQLCKTLTQSIASLFPGQEPQIISAPVAMLAGCQMPAVLIEPFALKTLPLDESSRIVWIKKYAAAIKTGIESYLNTL